MTQVTLLPLSLSVHCVGGWGGAKVKRSFSRERGASFVFINVPEQTFLVNACEVIIFSFVE